MAVKSKANSKQTEVTFVFKGEKAEELARFLFVEWLDGGLDQEFESRMNTAGLGRAIKYDWDDSPAYRFEIEVDNS